MMTWADELIPMIVRQARKKLGLTQEQLGELFGCDKTTVYQWEVGRRVPRKPNFQMFLLEMKKHGISFDSEGILVMKKKR